MGLDDVIRHSLLQVQYQYQYSTYIRTLVRPQWKERRLKGIQRGNFTRRNPKQGKQKILHKMHFSESPYLNPYTRKQTPPYTTYNTQSYSHIKLEAALEA